jgi:extracellular elastinolytic metalloproteinase
MGREVDVRRFETSRVSLETSEALRSLASEVSGSLPGGGRVRIESFDPTTGNPSATKAEGTPPVRGDYVRRALEHVQAIGPALGLRAQATEFVADPSAAEMSTGAVAVHLHQRYKGIPIFQASTTVRFMQIGRASCRERVFQEV